MIHWTFEQLDRGGVIYMDGRQIAHLVAMPSGGHVIDTGLRIVKLLNDDERLRELAWEKKCR